MLKQTLEVTDVHALFERPTWCSTEFPGSAREGYTWYCHARANEVRGVGSKINPSRRAPARDKIRCGLDLFARLL
ncbi:MAG TPA: hypothetical protein VK648_05805 [Gemmatimonadaceae bacterium]|nr:hypothetical protein [Gemmatimonadaceae bacterium]